MASYHHKKLIWYYVFSTRAITGAKTSSTGALASDGPCLEPPMQNMSSQSQKFGTSVLDVVCVDSFINKSCMFSSVGLPANLTHCQSTYPSTYSRPNHHHSDRQDAEKLKTYT
ncbi:hypothetical protein GOODEAATRI_029249 [Goodea atripinnis]|uniref:Uncharacterized protein n=1 Tax=Goodea atripinnis TaxID=208336 RepID=A0ABV0PI07_9TELE